MLGGTAKDLLPHAAGNFADLIGNSPQRPDFHKDFSGVLYWSSGTSDHLNVSTGLLN